MPSRRSGGIILIKNSQATMEKPEFAISGNEVQKQNPENQRKHE
jgi:hypothetical protein